MSAVASSRGHDIASAIVSGRLQAIVADMVTTVSNVARSPRISVRRQFGCALLDGQCNVAAADNPRYVASLAETTHQCVQAFKFDLAEDDILLTNDPYGGSPSIHYFTVVAPLKVDGQRTVYVAVEAHMDDIGGWVMGNYDPTAHEVRTEGTRFSPMKIVRFGRQRRDVVETVLLNSRSEDLFRGDLNALLAAVGRGRRELGALNARYGTELLEAGMRDAISYSSKRTKHALERIPTGRFTGRSTFQLGDDSWRVEVILERNDGDTTLNFSNTDAQAPIFVNSSPSMTRTQALIPLLGLLDEDIPWNSGMLQAVDIVSNHGSLVEPAYPGPTGWSLEHVGREVAESVRQALATALPQHAGSSLPSRDMAYTIRTKRLVGSVEQQLAVTELAVLSQPGSGAAHGIDGWGQPGPESLGLMPSIEEFEVQTDLTLQQMEYRCDSGGAGAARGGAGTSLVIEFPAESFERLYMVAASAENVSAGVSGGRPGQPGAISLRTPDGDWQRLTGISTNLPIPGGAILRIDSAGGGGYGDPRDRGRAEVEADVLDDYISTAAAQSAYGVDLASDGAGPATSPNAAGARADA